MERNHAGADRANASSAAAAASQLIRVMDELREVFLAENDLLRRGLPAALVEMVDRKTALSQEFAHLFQGVFGAHGDELAADPELRQRLMETGHELQDLSKENMWRLEAALNATRRRVDAVMMAIQAHDGETRTYGEGNLSIGQGLDAIMNLRA